MEEKYIRPGATTKEEKLHELVYQALGHASMCWKETPKGEFDGVEASKVGEQLIKDLKEFFANG